jgi:Fe(3+) dicitrate transport protein
MIQREVRVVLIALTMGGTPAAAQTGTIAGRVVDPNGVPIVAATVRLVTPERISQSGDRGTFQLDGVPPGDRTLIVTRTGFQSRLVPVRVEDGGLSTLTVILEVSAAALEEITVPGEFVPGSRRPAPDLVENLVLAGARTEVIELHGVAANLAEKNARQVFGRIPGMFVYDMDGSGNQINVATRGLDPHRSWELNVRQDGVVVNSDLYGYPASHYSLPLEGVQRIEYVRGTAALQYGSQFGGMINYVTRTPDSVGPARVELRTTAGSYGLVSGFGAVGGRLGALRYHGYASFRSSEGYRRSSASRYNAQFMAASLPLSPRITLRAQVGRSFYRYQVPGPLTDSMFRADPRAATRTRNWFSPDIVVPAVKLDWRPTPDARLTITSSAVVGTRGSVQFVGLATTPDAIDPQTGQYGTRQVHIDKYRSLTTEARFTVQHGPAGRRSTVAAGLAYSNNDTHRRQEGVGSRGSDYDLEVSGEFRRDIHYRTANIAAYAEHLTRVTPRWAMVPGFRLEVGRSLLTGRLAYYDPSEVPTDVNHVFPLFGLRTEYRIAAGTEAYGGISQAYRPMILKDVLPENALEKTDPDLKDARGWTLEGGLRGRLGDRLSYDLSAFLLRYDNRFGGLLQSDPGGEQVFFKTNVGSSLTRGVELAADVRILNTASMALSAFTATAWYRATYRRGSVPSGGRNVSIVGNRVEGVPTWTSRNGLTLTTPAVSTSISLSHVSSSFADPLNTVTPVASGAVGLVPAYTVADLTFGTLPTRWLRLRGGVTNLFDRPYFTKRPTFYPGPGIWPSDGRSFQLSLDAGW